MEINEILFWKTKRTYVDTKLNELKAIKKMWETAKEQWISEVKALRNEMAGIQENFEQPERTGKQKEREKPMWK